MLDKDAKMCVGKKKQMQNQKEQEKIGITKWMQ